MTETEKAKKYFEDSKDYYDSREPITDRQLRQIYLDGLAEGRKEGYEQGKNNERELQCGKKNKRRKIMGLTIEKMSEIVRNITGGSIIHNDDNWITVRISSTIGNFIVDKRKRFRDEIYKGEFFNEELFTKEVKKRFNSVKEILKHRGIYVN